MTAEPTPLSDEDVNDIKQELDEEPRYGLTRSDAFRLIATIDALTDQVAKLKAELTALRKDKDASTPTKAP
jgi:hypothetical protein